jgi:hypothetical protein
MMSFGVVAALMLAACGSESDSEPSPAVAEAEEPDEAPATTDEAAVDETTTTAATTTTTEPAVPDDVQQAYRDAGQGELTVAEYEEFSEACELLASDPVYQEAFWADDRADSDREQILTNIGPLCPEIRSVLDEAKPAPVAPLVFEGAGADVIVLDNPVTGPLLLRAAHTGSRNFQVTLLDDNGDRLEGLVNEIGDYTGTHAVLFRDRGAAAFIEVNADGAWSLSFDPVSSARTGGVATGDVTEGIGSDVIAFAVDGPTTVSVECTTCDSNFQVRAWGDSSRGLVNEIGVYQGRVLVPSDTLFLEINAGPGFRSPPGDWAIVVE